MRQWNKEYSLVRFLHAVPEGEEVDIYINMCFLVNDIEEEYNRIISLGYNNFKVKNGEIIYNIEGGKLFKVKAPEGTEVEIRDTNI